MQVLVTVRGGESFSSKSSFGSSPLVSGSVCAAAVGSLPLPAVSCAVESATEPSRPPAAVGAARRDLSVSGNSPPSAVPSPGVPHYPGCLADSATQ